MSSLPPDPSTAGVTEKIQWADPGDETLAVADFGIDTKAQTLSSAWSDYVARIKGGNLGSIPAVLGILVLVGFFGGTRHKTFLSVYNFANLLQQAALIIAIAIAVTFVLVLGEIDLAAGLTAGVTAAAIAASLKDGRPLVVALIIGFAAAAAIGIFTGFLVSRIGIPSFVVTLANFLMWQGVVLQITSEGGTIRVTDKYIVALDNGNLSVVASWLMFAVVVGGFAGARLWTAYGRRRRGVESTPTSVIVAQTAGLAVLWGVPTALLSQNRAKVEGKVIRGVPWAVLVILLLVVGLTFLVTRTAWGRHLYAVGGNSEAARRAGINVARIRMSAFVVCALLAGVGGLFIASRLNSVDPQIGGNDTLLVAVGAAVIGGTSLFGGRGRIVNAVLGGLVLAIIDNGLPLVGTMAGINFSKSGVKFIVKGVIVLIAASVDALSRRSASST